ncbi:adenylosuccinate synthase [Spiroplasma endosymbiont of Nomada ruficornis]|uniref:adenylosuccinate synthase n=1 Tax=Spiroplasma endosymbiont of Nomada ruficornis TaxID=3066325 RepID=UPI00313B6F2B
MKAKKNIIKPTIEKAKTKVEQLNKTIKPKVKDVKKATKVKTQSIKTDTLKPIVNKMKVDFEKSKHIIKEENQKITNKIVNTKNILISKIDQPKPFKTTAIIGCQWGDEGKGKITDYYSQNSDVIVRWSGGDNAGHTIVFDHQKYKLSIIPSGIFNKDSYCVIANGCVVNPEKLVSEIEYLKAAGFSCQNLRISDRAHIILPYHLAFDEYEEKIKGDKAIGTTKKGIGPCYADKVNRIGIRMGDLLDKERLLELITDNLLIKNKILKNVYGYEKEFNAQTIYNRLLELLPYFKDLIIDTGQFLNEQLVRNKKILFEGAQGTLLDLDHGTYPFVTSSNPSASSIAIGSGISLKAINEIIGVTKAYSTRVGAGAFPSEVFGKLADYIRMTGNEYGTVSKRPRRIGWFDAVIAKYSAQINGFTSLAVMLLDVLTGIETLSICTHYTLNGEIIRYIPSQINNFNKCQPHFITMPGWNEDITNITSYDELPENAKNYLKKISELVGVPIRIFSVGPDRKQTIFIKE